MTWRPICASPDLDRGFNPRFLSQMASYDVARNIWQALHLENPDRYQAGATDAPDPRAFAAGGDGGGGGGA